ncbi:MAG TPA: hypothetical protein VNS34_15255 [Rhizobiaceae bacterium]|nr:hypothetical protein [Rhizobiaceae bacterium]
MTLRGVHQEFGRPYDRRIVLEAVGLHGPTTRAAVPQRMGITAQTVSIGIRITSIGAGRVSAC